MEQQDRWQVFCPLTKVIPEQRIVFGRLTQELRDSANEIMDYARSKPGFQKWSDDARARTAHLPDGAQSLGNVRAMHKPISAGKVIDIQFNDSEKAVDIGCYIQDDDSWAKV